jgi:hypothetical protein
MQIEKEEEENIIGKMSEHDLVSLYHTKWLMAHNRLHDAVHKPSASLAQVWDAYLDDLKSAEKVARQDV